jgi:hypothetical protein
MVRINYKTTRQTTKPFLTGPLAFEKKQKLNSFTDPTGQYQVKPYFSRTLMLKMIEGNTLFTDGSKFRANVGNRETRSLEKWKRYEKHLKARIEELLKDAETKDSTESERSVFINKEY